MQNAHEIKSTSLLSPFIKAMIESKKEVKNGFLPIQGQMTENLKAVSKVPNTENGIKAQIKEPENKKSTNT